MNRLFLIYLMSAVLLLIGCGQSSEEKAVEQQIEKETGSDAQVDLSEKGMTITGKTEEGEFQVSSGDAAEIPKGFPDDVFVYHPSQTQMAMKLPEGYSVTLTTKDEQPKIAEAYKKEMADKGWSEQASMLMGTNTMLVYEKGARSASVTISSSEDAIAIQLTVSNN